MQFSSLKHRIYAKTNKNVFPVQATFYLKKEK